MNLRRFRLPTPLWRALVYSSLDALFPLAAAAPVTAAGDAICAAEEPVTPHSCPMTVTAKHLERAGVDAVLALGDLQYPAGALADLRASYDRSWGAFKAKTYPVLGNHEYRTPGAAGYFAYFGPARATRSGASTASTSARGISWRSIRNVGRSAT